MKNHKTIIILSFLLGCGLFVSCTTENLPVWPSERPYQYPRALTLDAVSADKSTPTIGVLDFSPDIKEEKMSSLAPDSNLSRYVSETLLKMLGDKRINTVPVNGKCTATEPSAIAEEIQKVARDNVNHYLIGNILEWRLVGNKKETSAIKLVLDLKLFYLPSKSIVFNKTGTYASEIVLFTVERCEDDYGGYNVRYYTRVYAERETPIPKNELSKYIDNAVFNALKMVINDPMFIEKLTVLEEKQ
ncbi:MAG: hypothetical protein AB1599_02035 [Planctomycetota bacterium]